MLKTALIERRSAAASAVSFWPRRADPAAPGGLDRI